MRPELVIGFAAETNRINKNAEDKLNKKNCDWIISNDVSNKDIGFKSDYNEVIIHYKNKDIKRYPNLIESFSFLVNDQGNLQEELLKNF